MLHVFLESWSSVWGVQFLGRGATKCFFKSMKSKEAGGKRF